MRVGVFDSGLGGLTVLRELKQRLPGYTYIYYADTAHLPYGEKSPEQVAEYAKEIVSFLLAQKVKAIIMGCNLSSCVALPWARKRCDIPVFGLVEEAAQKAAMLSRTREVGVLCTPATATTGAYEQAIKKADNKVTVHTLACEPFVPMVERGEVAGEEVKEIVKQKLRSLAHTSTDTLIYGCSHFPFLDGVIRSLFPQWQIVDPAPLIADFFARMMEAFGVLGESRGDTLFYASGTSRSLITLGSAYLGEVIKEVHPVQEGAVA